MMDSHIIFIPPTDIPETVISKSELERIRVRNAMMAQAKAAYENNLADPKASATSRLLARAEWLAFLRTIEPKR